MLELTARKISDKKIQAEFNSCRAAGFQAGRGIVLGQTFNPDYTLRDQERYEPEAQARAATYYLACASG
jgi:hypothetical protein